MERISYKSRIEIWSDLYINNINEVRREEDDPSKVEIIQIEPGNSEKDYIVEVRPKEKEDAGDQSKKNSLIFANGKLSAMNIIVTRLKEECDNPNRNWYGSAIYSEVRDVLCDIEMEFKNEVDKAAGETPDNK